MNDKTVVDIEIFCSIDCLILIDKMEESFADNAEVFKPMLLSIVRALESKYRLEIRTNEKLFNLVYSVMLEPNKPVNLILKKTKLLVTLLNKKLNKKKTLGTINVNI